MKTAGAILAIIGSLSFTFIPFWLPLLVIGLLLFIQGCEREIIKKTVNCIQNNKSPDEQEQTELTQRDKDLYGYSTN